MTKNFLHLGPAYLNGAAQFHKLIEEMLDGKPIMCEEDAGIIFHTVCNSKRGDHLEIGTAYGGSAILALRAMDFVGRTTDKVVCIDPFGEERRDTLYKAVEKEFWRNVEHFDIKHRIEHIKSFSHPLPLDEGRRFSTALIDGDHSYEYVLNDWNNLKEIVDDCIIFHDYVKSSVRKVVLHHAALTKGWTLIAVLGWSAVMRRGR